MVQRKAVSKLGIQAESSKSHVASEKRSAALKPCSQHQDSRNKGGGEIKKKMKKSRSFKASDFESLGSPLRRDQSRFKKLSVDVSKATAPQKKTSPVKISDGSPNYMKPTSSSDARKEGLHLQVSPQLQTTDKNKSPRNSDRLKASSASGLKPMKVLKRKSSLKPVRPSMKKSYGVALYPNLNASQATCSSTLKDSKFPPYVDLHPEGTELEGTSVMKVCPYTYCSLNGHCHAPSPPLKRFLSARRRLLKTQKSMKLRGLSSPRLKNSRDRNKEIDTGQMGFDGDPTVLELNSGGSEISPVIEEVYTDFFLEIFAKPRGESPESVNYGDASRIWEGDDEPNLDFADSPEVLEETSSDGGDEIPPPGSIESSETDMEEDGVAESQFNEPKSKISGEDDLVISLFVAEMDVSMIFSEDQDFDKEVEVQGSDNLVYWIQANQEEKGSECSIESDASKEAGTIGEKGMGEDESVSVAIDMDWEEEAPYFDNGIDYLTFSDDGSVSITAQLPGIEDPHVLAYDADDSVGTFEEAAEEAIILQEVYEEDAERFKILFAGANYEGNDVTLDDGDANLEIGEVPYATDGVNHNQPSVVGPESLGQCNENYAEESVTLSDLQNDIVYSSTSFIASAENFAGNPTEVSEQDNDFMYEHAPLEDDTKGDICATELRSLEYDPETEQFAVTEDHSSDHQHPYTDSENPELNELHDGVLLEGQTSEIVNSEMDHLVFSNYYREEQVLQSTSVGDAAERKEDGNSNGLLKIQISDLSETGHDTADEDHSAEHTNMENEVCQCDSGITQENRCSQEAVIDLNSIIPDQSIPPVNQFTFVDQKDVHDMDENQDSVKDQGNLEYHYVSKSTIKESDTTESYGSSSAEDCIGTNDKMQLEDKTMMCTDETHVAADIKSPENDETIINTGTDCDKPIPETYGNLKGKAKKVCKRPIENREQLKKFNPREPRYLVPEPDPEGEQVDLRHQMMDERKNAEEWMIDHALQQAVTKLAPARKRRVALLVEAFEAVIPLPKFEAHLRHAAESFTRARPIQACS